MKQKLLAAAQAILIAVAVLSGSIALPILFRPFFYWHIEPMGLARLAGIDAQQVRDAYNAMMDFCIGVTDTFSTGVLPFSEEGMAHFIDVKKLFVLDLRVLVGAVVLLTVVTVLRKKVPVKLCGHTPGFWGAIGLGASFLVIGGLAALDFDRAFVIFHQLFFPGKSNWVFDGRKDPIIYMLPAEFFRNCAIFILAGILLSCGGLILWDRKKRKG